MDAGLLLPMGLWGRTPVMERLLEAAERFGYDSVWVADHLVFPRTLGSQYPYNRSGPPFRLDRPTLEPLTTLAWVAGQTKRVKLGTSVLVAPYRHPLLTAKIVATLDYLSGGRAMLGVGPGWLEEEFALLGADFKHRGTVTDEQIQLWRAVWSQDNPSFQGKHYQVSNIWFEPKPVQRGAVPIWIGGTSAPAIRRTALLGDGWAPPPLATDQLREGIVRIQEQRARAGKAGPFAMSASVSNARLTKSPGGPDREPMQGSPEQVRDDLERWRSVGVTHVRVRPHVTGDVEATVALLQELQEEVFRRVR